MDTTPTLFLDFDGPLHSAEILAINRYGEFLPHPDLFAGIPILHSLLEPFPHLQIVVSSDWRLFVDDDTLRQVLGPLASRFAGVMEILTSSRAEAIRQEAQRRRLSAWLAIDDHPTVAEAAKDDHRFVACDPITGISPLGVQQELVGKIAAMVKSAGIRTPSSALR